MSKPSRKALWILVGVVGTALAVIVAIIGIAIYIRATS